MSDDNQLVDCDVESFIRDTREYFEKGGDEDISRRAIIVRMSLMRMRFPDGPSNFKSVALAIMRVASERHWKLEQVLGSTALNIEAVQQSKELEVTAA